MRILFDNNTPRLLRRYLTEHSVDTAREKGWAEFTNGNLLDNAEGEGYEIMITGDQSMRYQQNMAHWQMAVEVLLSNRWPDVQSKIGEIQSALEGIGPGEIREIPI